METTREKFDKITSYETFDSYINLSPGDKLFFDKMFHLLLHNGSLTWSNKKLSDITGESISTLEKRLKRLETSKLLLRETVKTYDSGKWRTDVRVIKLNPYYFQFDFNSMAHKIYCNYVFQIKAEEVMNKYLEMPFDEFIKAFGKVKVANI